MVASQSVGIILHVYSGNVLYLLYLLVYSEIPKPLKLCATRLTRSTKATTGHVVRIA